MPHIPPLPRVTYTNFKEDFTPVHDWLDKALPDFRANVLGKNYPNIINGKENGVGTRYAVGSPISHTITLGNFIIAEAEVVHEAITSAENAFKEWSRWTWTERTLLMRRIAEEIDKEKYNLGMAALYEVGKSRLEAIGEAEECVDFIKYYCDEMDRNQGFQGTTHRAYPNEDARFELKPYGVFACVSPFNFPLAMVINMITGAILTGNTVVLKPSPGAGLTSSLIVKIYERAGLPKGVLNMVCGDDGTGKALVNDPRIAGVVFTGSRDVGMELYRKMAAKNIAGPMILEMGGKNPSYVTASADLDIASQGVLRSAFGMSGQKCSANSKCYVHKDVASQFIKLLVERTQQLKLGNVEERDVYMGPVLTEGSARRFKKAIEDAKTDGKILCGGSQKTGGFFDEGFYCEPTIISKLPANHRLHKDELFNPILCIQEFTNLEDAIRDGNDVLYGLTAGLYSQDRKEIELFCDKAEAGVLYINRASGATTGTWPGTQTFTGWKASGVSGKGGMGPFYLPQFMREQSQTRWFGAF